MKLLIVDAQGGGFGKQLVSGVKRSFREVEIIAVGANSVATGAMLKAGADHAATGENAVIVGCRNADLIAGPVGIVIADSLYGEITPAMALAVAQSKAKRILIPYQHCDNIIAGVSELSVGKLIQCAVDEIGKFVNP